MKDKTGRPTSERPSVSNFYDLEKRRLHVPLSFILDGMINSVDATKVIASILSGATYNDVQDFMNFFGDRTYLSGCAITPTSPADGTVAVAAGTAWCKESDSNTAVGKFFNFAGQAAIALTDMMANILYLDYNAGAPQVVVATSALTYGFQQDHILLGPVFRNGNETHILQADPLGIQGDNRSHMMRVEEGASRSSGMATTSVGTRNLAVTAGVLHLGLNRKTTPPYTTPNSGTADATEANKLHDADGGFVATDVGKIVHNTTDDTYTEVTAYVDAGELTLRDDIFISGENYDLDIFSYWYYNFTTSAWVEVPGSTVISNSQYNLIGSGTGLANLTANRFGVHWVYMDFDGHLHVVYGQGDYTANQAEEAAVPASLPNIATDFSVLIAKIICQQGTDTLTITYPWTSVFTSTLATDHGSLGGLADDDHTQYIKHSLATAANNFLVASGAGTFIKKTLAEVKTILGLVSDYIAKSLVDAKGDIIAASGDNTPVRVAVGANDKVLTADSAAAGGVAWADPIPKATDWKGNFNWDTSAYTTVETDISTLFSTNLAIATRRKYSVKLDLTNVEADGSFVSLYIAVKEKIDGTNYRAIDRKLVEKADIAATAEPGIIIDIPATSENIQITMQMSTALAGDATIYYAVVKEHLE